MPYCLIVDDSAVIRKVARRIMEGLGLRVAEAEDGEQALLSCRAEMPDGVLLDWAAPVVSGYDFLRTLRGMPGGHAPKVVLSLIEADVATLARATLAGASDHLLKPFDREIMTAKLRKVGLV